VPATIAQLVPLGKKKEDTYTAAHMPTYATNKKARFDYELLEEIEAGIMLTGNEVKSIRSGRVNLKGSFISFHGDTPMASNVHISKYANGNYHHGYNPTAPRKILLHKKQIDYIKGKSQERGLTIVPISLYSKGQFIKIKIAIARGKKQHDKRDSIKRRDQNRELRRMMKH
jgi:SsrA-binding protein